MATHKRRFSLKKITLYSLGAVAGLLVLLLGIYFVGPRPAPPQYIAPKWPDLPSDLTVLAKNIQAAEDTVVGLRPNNQARIVFADSVKKNRTPIVFLYLHGFGASPQEGYPVHQSLAKRYGANLFLARLYGHGTERGDENFKDFTADKYYTSAEYALHIAKQLGDSVVILGCSGGGALSIFLASRHPEIKAILTYAPAIKVARKEAALLAGPWGLHIAEAITGKKHNDWTWRKPEQALYWTNHQAFEGVAQFTLFQKTALTPETFAKVTCPFFMAYYYEDETHQDKVVSVAAMLDMFGQLGTPSAQKQAVNCPTTKDHVMVSDILSQDWPAVLRASEGFLDTILNLKPIK